MGKIVISEFVSLDGVIQDPDGKEGFRVGGWVGQIKDREELNTIKLDEALSTEALLLGRRSYEFFAARWQPRGGDLAKRLNSLPKYVVSSTLQDPDWNNSTVLKGDVVNVVSKLKQHRGQHRAGQGKYDNDEGTDLMRCNPGVSTSAVDELTGPHRLH
jgi:dihydrofolate reductase